MLGSSLEFLRVPDHLPISLSKTVFPRYHRALGLGLALNIRPKLLLVFTPSSPVGLEGVDPLTLGSRRTSMLLWPYSSPCRTLNHPRTGLFKASTKSFLSNGEESKALTGVLWNNHGLTRPSWHLRSSLSNSACYVLSLAANYLVVSSWWWYRRFLLLLSFAKVLCKEVVSLTILPIRISRSYGSPRYNTHGVSSEMAHVVDMRSIRTLFG